MKIAIDDSSPIPIYAQLVEQIKWEVSSRHVVPGEQLPTVRQLAVELRVNPNTVARAYSELERMGIIATRQGRGTFALPQSRQTFDDERNAGLKRLARAAVIDAARQGFKPSELAQAILEMTE